MAQPSAKTFRAVLERSQSRLNWVIARIPFDGAKAWGARGQIKVRGEINGFAFRTSLFPTGEGTHVLLVNKRMQAGGRTAPGMTARFRLEPDTAERVISLPPELVRAFSGDRALRRWFDGLNYSTRRYLTDSIAEVKSPAARMRRAEQTAERLLATMEAEKDLPPIFRIAFARDPLAQRGWELMPAGRRRQHLLAIFYYREPKSQARRMAQALEEARQRTSK